MLPAHERSFRDRYPVSRRHIRGFCRAILSCIEYLHTPDPGASKPSIIHRDIKCDNIFKSGQSIKIGDLGLATEAAPDVAKTVLGTPEFMAPEMYRTDGDYSASVDIHAFAMSVLEMIMGEAPYSECRSFGDMFRKITSGSPPDVLEQASWVWPEAADFVVKAIGSGVPEEEPEDGLGAEASGDDASDDDASEDDASEDGAPDAGADPGNVFLSAARKSKAPRLRWSRPGAKELMGHPFVADAVELSTAAAAGAEDGAAAKADPAPDAAAAAGSPPPPGADEGASDPGAGADAEAASGAGGAALGASSSAGHGPMPPLPSPVAVLAAGDDDADDDARERAWDAAISTQAMAEARGAAQAAVDKYMAGWYEQRLRHLGIDANAPAGAGPAAGASSDDPGMTLAVAVAGLSPAEAAELRAERLRIGRATALVVLRCVVESHEPSSSAPAPTPAPEPEVTLPPSGAGGTAATVTTDSPPSVAPASSATTAVSSQPGGMSSADAPAADPSSSSSSPSPVAEGDHGPGRPGPGDATPAPSPPPAAPAPEGSPDGRERAGSDGGADSAGGNFGSRGNLPLDTLVNPLSPEARWSSTDASGHPAGAGDAHGADPLPGPAVTFEHSTTTAPGPPVAAAAAPQAGGPGAPAVEQGEPSMRTLLEAIASLQAQVSAQTGLIQSLQRTVTAVASVVLPAARSAGIAASEPAHSRSGMGYVSDGPPGTPAMAHIGRGRSASGWPGQPDPVPSSRPPPLAVRGRTDGSVTPASSAGADAGSRQGRSRSGSVTSGVFGRPREAGAQDQGAASGRGQQDHGAGPSISPSGSVATPVSVGAASSPGLHRSSELDAELELSRSSAVVEDHRQRLERSLQPERLAALRRERLGLEAAMVDGLIRSVLVHELLDSDDGLPEALSATVETKRQTYQKSLDEAIAVQNRRLKELGAEVSDMKAAFVKKQGRVRATLERTIKRVQQQQRERERRLAAKGDAGGAGRAGSGGAGAGSLTPTADAAGGAAAGAVGAAGGSTPVGAAGPGGAASTTASRAAEERHRKVVRDMAVLRHEETAARQQFREDLATCNAEELKKLKRIVQRRQKIIQERGARLNDASRELLQRLLELRDEYVTPSLDHLPEAEAESRRGKDSDLARTRADAVLRTLTVQHDQSARAGAASLDQAIERSMTTGEAFPRGSTLSKDAKSKADGGAAVAGPGLASASSGGGAAGLTAGADDPLTVRTGPSPMAVTGAAGIAVVAPGSLASGRRSDVGTPGARAFGASQGGLGRRSRAGTSTSMSSAWSSNGGAPALERRPSASGSMRGAPASDATAPTASAGQGMQQPSRPPSRGITPTSGAMGVGGGGGYAPQPMAMGNGSGSGTPVRPGVVAAPLSAQESLDAITAASGELAMFEQAATGPAGSLSPAHMLGPAGVSGPALAGGIADEFAAAGRPSAGANGTV